jgi:hypothetical protein
MGKYINNDSKGNNLPIIGKANALILDGAKRVSDEEYLENMVCVVENSFFDAAAYAYCEQEYEYFKVPDGRNKIWLVYPLANKLAK